MDSAINGLARHIVNGLPECWGDQVVDGKLNINLTVDADPKNLCRYRQSQGRGRGNARLKQSKEHAKDEAQVEQMSLFGRIPDEHGHAD